MKRLVEFPLEDGGSIMVEVEEVESGSGMVPAARPGEIAAKANQTFEEALEKVRVAAGTIIAKLRNLSDSPDEVEVEFGLKMSASAGAILTSVGVEANYKVVLSWKDSKKES